MEKENPMQIPLQISFRNMDPSPAVEARIREKAAKLERFHDRIVGCTWWSRRHTGIITRASFTTCESISACRERMWWSIAPEPIDHAHEDVYVAFRDAFDAAVTPPRGSDAEDARQRQSP